MAYEPTNKLELSKGMYDKEESPLAKIMKKKNAAAYNYQSQDQQTQPTSSQRSQGSGASLASGLGMAAQANSAGSDTQSVASGAIQGGLTGAAAGAGIGAAAGPQGAGIGAVIGAGVGALSGIMNAKANQQSAKIRAEQEKAYKLADLYQRSGDAQQGALQQLMNSYNNILR